MNNIKMFLIATMMMIGSFVATKAKFTVEERITIEKLSQITLAQAVIFCDKSEENYIVNSTLFEMAVDQMSFDEIAAMAPFINKCIAATTIKAFATECHNCKTLSEQLEKIISDSNKAIAAKQGSSTYFELFEKETLKNPKLKKDFQKMQEIQETELRIALNLMQKTN